MGVNTVVSTVVLMSHDWWRHLDDNDDNDDWSRVCGNGLEHELGGQSKKGGKGKKVDGNERSLLVETRTPTTPTTTVSIDDCQERKGEYSKQKKAEKRVKTLYTCQTALQLIVVPFFTVCLLPFLLFLSVGRWRLLHKKL